MDIDYWFNHEASASQAMLVQEALELVHLLIHIEAHTFDEEEEEQEAKEVFTEHIQELLDDHDTIDVIKALFGAATSLAVNYEMVTDFDHGELIDGILETIGKYVSRMN
jgi:uncharacterized membrane-anchored protein